MDYEIREKNIRDWANESKEEPTIKYVPRSKKELEKEIEEYNARIARYKEMLKNKKDKNLKMRIKIEKYEREVLENKLNLMW